MKKGDVSMFFKKLKNKLFLLLLLFISMPINVFAYSEYIIAGGENIGIELNSSHVMIVGTYKIGSSNPAIEAGLKVGDQIYQINHQEIDSIESMVNLINQSSNKAKIKISYYRNNMPFETSLEMIKEDEIYKTGLYVKDSISGIGTLTFIDPNTNLYGALGHEIIEKVTGKKLEIKSGKIYNSFVTDITPSINGTPGEKNARYNMDEIYGDVKENTTSGIFGMYTDKIPEKKLYKVANQDDIKLGEAKMLTVLDGEQVGEYKINILKINHTEKQKNILFEIVDQNLLEKTGGIVQGMSGSPIIQGDYIIGAVTHVVVDNPTKGYGILITSMLEEAEN